MPAAPPPIPDHVPVSEMLMSPGPVRRQLLWLSFTWVFYGASYVATNFYITYWLTQYKGFSSSQASELLLACGGIGFFFYIIGGWLGETARPARGDHRLRHSGGAPERAVPVRAGPCRRRRWCISCYTRPPTALGRVPATPIRARAFPTRVRGTAVGFLSAMQVAGFVVGSILWTVMSNYGQPTLTWLVVATAASLGMWATLCLRRIPPGQELEATAGA